MAKIDYDKVAKEKLDKWLRNLEGENDDDKADDKCDSNACDVKGK